MQRKIWSLIIGWRILNLLSVLLLSLSLSLSPLVLWQVWGCHERPLRLTKFPIRTAAWSSASYKSDADDIPPLLWLSNNTVSMGGPSLQMQLTACLFTPKTHNNRCVEWRHCRLYVKIPPLSFPLFIVYVFPSTSLPSITPGSLPLMWVSIHLLWSISQGFY